MRCLLCVVLGFSLGACNGSEAEPTLDGKTASAWRADLEASDQRDAALQRLATAGDEAVPILSELLEVTRGHAPIIAAQILADHGAAGVPPLTKALAARSDSVRIAAAAALGLIGTPAQSALPKLRVMRDAGEADHLHIAACVGIWGIGRDPSEVMPTMLAGLKSNTPEVRFAATGLAALLGASAVKPLMVVLESDDPKLRVAAADSLAAIGEDAAPAKHRLEALLLDREPTTPR